MQNKTAISPILAIDGVLTIVTTFALAFFLPETNELWKIVAAIVWLGFATTHIIGWLAVVARVASIRTVLQKVNALKLYDFTGFLWIYLVLTLAMLTILFI